MPRGPCGIGVDGKIKPDIIMYNIPVRVTARNVVVANLSGAQKSHVDNFDVVFVVICSPQKNCCYYSIIIFPCDKVVVSVRFNCDVKSF